MGSEEPPKFRPKAPWYRNGDYYAYIADEYLQKLYTLHEETPEWSEVSNSMAFNRTRLIFESNLIEGAGLPSEGETRRLIEEHFPVLPGRPRDYFPFLGKDGGLKIPLSKDNLKEVRRAIKQSGLPRGKVIPSVSFSGKSRAFREVLQHYQALEHAQHLARDWWDSISTEYLRVIGALLLKKGDRDDEFPQILKEVNVERLRHKRLFAHTNLKKLHRVLAHGLVPNDAGVPAGQYRIDNRSVGWDLAFPAPELVRESMDNFVGRSDRLLMGVVLVDSGGALYQTAAEISYHFVRVHPFPDFNGRLSRIIMNMVLWIGGCPIPIAIRGDRKGRKRYFTALRHANRGNMKFLEALIAMRTTETFQEIDANLELAGLPTIWSVDVDKDQENHE